MDGPPGHQPAQNEPPPCYNCGMRGHMFMACPEPTRAVPAGLEASRARQHSGGGDRGDMDPNRNPRGPIVTRYAQTPRPGPVITRYGPPPGAQHPQGPPQSYLAPPHQQFGQGYGAGYPPPQAPPYHNYGPPGPPGPPQPYGTPPYSQPAYQHAFVPPSYHGPPHGPPGSHPLPGPPGHYQGPSQQGPPYALPSHYPQPTSYGFQGPPLQGYPPPNYVQHTAYIPPGYPPYPPNGAHSPQQPYSDERRLSYSDHDQGQYRDESQSRVRRDGQHGSHRGHNRHGRDRHDGIDRREPDRQHNNDRRSDRGSRDHRVDHRGDRGLRDLKGNERRRGRRDRRDRQDRLRSRSPSGGSGSIHSNSRRTHAPLDTSPKATLSENFVASLMMPESDKAPEEIATKEPTTDSVAKAESENEGALPETPDDEPPYDNFLWDMDTIFNEITPSHQGDPIGEPLPFEYTDQIMLPPAFNATGVKSKYIIPKNLDDFALSVRDTDEWKKLKHHPTFLDPNEITLQNLEKYNSMANQRHGQSHDRKDRLGHLQNLGRNGSKEPVRNHKEQRDQRRKPDNQRKRRWAESQIGYEDYHDNRGLATQSRLHQDFEAKRPKQVSPEPGEVTESGSPPGGTVPRQSPEFPVGRPIRDLDFVEDTDREYMYKNSYTSDLGGREAHAYDRYMNDSEPRRREEERSARDIVHSTIDTLFPPGETDRTRASQEAALAPRLPPPNRTLGRRGSKGSHFGSRPSSRRSSYGHLSQPESAGSPLTPLEAELLGMVSSDSEDGRKSPVRPADDQPAKKRRQPRVDAAYSRRW